MDQRASPTRNMPQMADKGPYPSSASLIAGWRTSPIDIVPHFSRESIQPAHVPTKAKVIALLITKFSNVVHKKQKSV
jgi:hypothetical protein